mmetsp:Transcript_4054/g.16960  ORF Transcript_4054/g.16960 Transcript_4054/m.16960 type:complete len:313 (-) Transcript_4054:699-1637(-)
MSACRRITARTRVRATAVTCVRKPVSMERAPTTDPQERVSMTRPNARSMSTGEPSALTGRRLASSVNAGARRLPEPAPATAPLGVSAPAPSACLPDASAAARMMDVRFGSVLWTPATPMVEPRMLEPERPRGVPVMPKEELRPTTMAFFVPRVLERPCRETPLATSPASDPPSEPMWCSPGARPSTLERRWSDSRLAAAPGSRGAKQVSSRSEWSALGSCWRSSTRPATTMITPEACSFSFIITAPAGYSRMRERAPLTSSSMTAPGSSSKKAASLSCWASSISMRFLKPGWSHPRCTASTILANSFSSISP